MELGIFIGIVFLGLFIYYYFKKKKSSINAERNYYYKRYLRNKLQTERNISELKKIIDVLDDYEQIWTKSGNMSIYQFYEEQQNDYKIEYSKEIFKNLNRNKLSHGDKKKYAKLLINQSEKLYHVEVDLAYFKQKLNETSYISTSQTHV